MTIRARCVFTEADRKQQQKVQIDRCWSFCYSKSSSVSQWTIGSKDQQQAEKAKPPTIVSGSSTLVAGDLVPGHSTGLTWCSYIGKGDMGC